MDLYCIFFSQFPRIFFCSIVEKQKGEQIKQHSCKRLHNRILLSYTLQSIFSHKKFKGCLNSLMDADATTSNILRFL